MNTTKLWRLTFVMLAALSLASCSSDDEDKISESQISKTLSEMKNNYGGQLQIGLKNESSRLKLEGFAATSDKGLNIAVPVDMVADQVKDEAIANEIRKLGTFSIYSDYDFLSINDNTAHFLLKNPHMVADADTQANQSVKGNETSGAPRVELQFSDNYGGDFVKENGALVFNLCLENVLINNQYLEGFRPVFFHYEGAAKTPIVPYHSVWKNTCQIRYSFFGASEDLLRFYDVNIEYLDINGRQHTDKIANAEWLYESAPISVVDMPEEFKCRISAVRKTDAPELTADVYEIGYGISSKICFLNPEGELVYMVKHSQPSSFTFETDKVGMQLFIDSTPEIEIEDFSMKINKDDVFARLKQ